MKEKKINYMVFLPVLVLFIVCIIFAFFNNQLFVQIINRINNGILDKFGWLFIIVSVLALIVCIMMYFSSFGNTVIGGKSAKPTLPRWSWFTITLCTTIGSGIIFWGAAEPVQHILFPPVSLELAPLSSEAAIFAMSTIFKHWTVLPYALYTVFTVMFAFSYYNLRKSFSVASALFPGEKMHYESWIVTIIDIICVFSLVMGLSASLYAD